MEFAYRYYSSDLGPYPFEESDRRLGHWKPGLWTNNGTPDEQAAAEVDTQMKTLTDGVQNIWVMRSEVEMWDNRHLMTRWLDEHAIKVEQQEYHGTQVHQYEFPE
ncbi:hypothetical protein KFU94_06300 [Chloroflexi bacterium TSY]|nr:hypothetical protein [Chloroflexi bacterium TSY]